MNCNQVEHQLAVKAALAQMPSAENIDEMACRFKAIAEPSRLRILFALVGGELCVEHITEAVAGNQSAVSHQLKILKDAKMIKSRRQGKNILYAIVDEHVLQTLALAKEHCDCHA